MEKIKFPKFSIRIATIMVIDLLLMALAFFVCYYYTEQVVHANVIGGKLFSTLLCYVAVYFCSIALLGGYLRKTLYRLSATVLLLLASTILTDAIIILINLGETQQFLFGLLLCTALSFTLLTAARIVHKLTLERFILKPGGLFRAKPALIIGAGFSGKMIYRELVEGDSGYTPVCFVDDDESLSGRSVCGLPVYSSSMLVPELVKEYNIALVVLAIPSIKDEQRTRILSYCKDLDCKVRVLPSLNALIENESFFNQAHTVDVKQLLGREVITLRNSAAEQLISGKTCLITGGGGSIGSELCRQIISLNPKRICILDIYENNAYEIQQELLRNGYPKEQLVVEIASVRDYNKLDFLFNLYRFDIVFHAAAHKHVPLMEDNPEEAVKNNVAGTYNVARLAQKYRVQNMLLISTDKAVNPTNVMGATKRVCEMVLQSLSQLPQNPTKFAMVRFGNVLGSNGSVIPLFSKQIEQGGPVTVTHPDIIRYFMTIPEAVALVIEAAAMAKGGEVFVLDMGEPVKIVTLAENLIKMYGYEPYVDIDIDFCGLRPGEKLFEELLMNDEGLGRTENNKIFIGSVQQVDNAVFEPQLQELLTVAGENNSGRVVELLHQVVDTYHSPKVNAHPHGEPVLAK